MLSLLLQSEFSDTPPEFPSLFTLYTILFALLVLYYLLLSPQARALSITPLLLRLLHWATGSEHQLKISQTHTRTHTDGSVGVGSRAG
jgi:hypothetical protein